MDKREQARRVSLLLSAGAVAALALLAFAPALSNGWVWDDRALILRNGLVHGLDGARLRAMFAGPVLTTYMPLGWLSFALLLRAFGADPRAFHAVTLVLHAACAVLLWLVCRRLMEGKRRAEAGAFAAAALFAVHPLQLWTAAWAIELPDAAATALFLACLLVYLGGRSARRLAACLAFFALSLLFRWKAVCLPVALLALDYWPLRRRDVRRALLEKLALGALSALAVFATLAGKSQEGLAPQLSAAAPARALLLFLRLFAWPFGLETAYAVSGPAAGWLSGAAAAALVVLVTALLWLQRARRPALLAAWAVYAAALAPSALAARAGAAFVFPPYGYLASLPLFALAGEGARRLWDSSGGKAALAAALAALLLASRRSCAMFRDQSAFWHAYLLAEPAFQPLQAAYVDLADDLMDRGRFDDAWFYVAFAVTRDPRNASAQAALARLNREAAGLHPDLPDFWVRESRDVLALGAAEDAARLCEKALSRKPRSAAAHEALADALDARGRFEEAARHRALAQRWGAARSGKIAR